MSEDVLSDAFFLACERDASRRLRRSRFKHTQGVTQSAALLAKTYGVDVRKAQLAGLLHDWDKGYDEDEIRARARALDIDVDPFVLESMPHLLHGPTAAAGLKRTYPGLPDDVLQAIARHTSAAIDMSDLDMVIYIADAIEPGREYEGLDELRTAIGEVSLEELFIMTFNYIFLMLVKRRQLLHPTTVDVWNHYVARSREAKAKKGTA